jgi:hypothetical protein
MQPETTQAYRPIGALRVISVCPSGALAMGTLCAVLELSRATLIDLLGRTPIVLPVPPGKDARRLRGFLMTMGLRVADCDPRLTDRFDLCIQLKAEAALEPLVSVLHPVLDPVFPMTDTALRDGLAAPDGLVLPLLSASAAEVLVRRLRRVRQVSVMQSRSSDAVCDVFAPMGQHSGLTSHLRLLGYSEDPLTGALAAGLDRHVAGHLARRFPQVRVIDRAFQRFDVMLTRVNGRVGTDIADFLTGRTGLGRNHFDLVSPAMPLRLETGLLREVALRFRHDYASIGLPTFVRLSHPVTAV